jgi:hypothetical protein
MECYLGTNKVIRENPQRLFIEVAWRGCSERLLGEVVWRGCSAKVVAWRGCSVRLLSEVAQRGYSERLLREVAQRGCLERLLGEVAKIKITQIRCTERLHKKVSQRNSLGECTFLYKVCTQKI